jgi:IS30 family transposase
MKNKNGTVSHKENIKKLRALGYTYNQIQKELGCSKSTISYHLGDGQVEKSNKRSEKRREEMIRVISKIKEDSGCVDCKVKHEYHALHFDHVRGKKIDNISKMIKWYTYNEVMEEIKKCDIVCANCHAYRTNRRIKEKK